MTDEVQGTPSGAPQGDPASTENQAPVRPENVPEKFWDAATGTVNTDALLASYTELEKARSKPQDTPEGAPEGEPQGESQQPPESGDTSAYTQAVEKATAELAEGGAISDETYEAFSKQGISREQIDTYVAGQQAMFELRKVHVEREVGGEQVYADILTWAGANLSEADANQFNETVFGPNRDAALDAVRALKTRYENEMGTEGKIVTTGAGSTTPGGYTDKSEWLADMRKPEYKKDAKFRDSVRTKLDAALKNGVNMGVGISMG